MSQVTPLDADWRYDLKTNGRRVADDVSADHSRDRASLKHTNAMVEQVRLEGCVGPGERWLLFGVLASLLPALLLVRTLMHVLNIQVGRRPRWHG